MDAGKLRGIIAKKGILYKDLAEVIGKTETGFSLKVKEGRFTIDEVVKIASHLEMTVEEVQHVFFEN